MKAIRTVLLAAACTAAAWSAALALFGGFKGRVFGILIRSNEPGRVFLIACVALAGYFIAGGRIPRQTIRRLGSGVSRLVQALNRTSSRTVQALARRPGLVAAALAFALAITAMAGSTRIAGGADAYGYVSQADLWLAGDLVIK